MVPGTHPIPRIGTGIAADRGMLGIGKRFVYVLRSDVDPSRHDVGVTSDVGNRLEWHNRGPWGQGTLDQAKAPCRGPVIPLPSGA